MSKTGDFISRAMTWQPFHPRWLNVMGCLLFGGLGVAATVFAYKTGHPDTWQRFAALSMWAVASVLLLSAAVGFILRKPCSYLAVCIAMLVGPTSFVFVGKLDYRIFGAIFPYVWIAYSSYRCYRVAGKNPQVIGDAERYT